MAFFIDSAFLDDITRVARTVPLAGVTTNPTILRTAYERGQRLQPEELLSRLLDEVPGLIFMQPGSPDEDEMYRQVESYLQIDPQRVIPKIPMTAAGVRVARRLKADAAQNSVFGDLPLAFTAVTTVAQAYLATQVGAAYIIPYYGRLENSGIDASKRISEMGQVLENNLAGTLILAASIKSSKDAARALCAGAHHLTVAPQVLLDMISDPLSEEAIARFNQDWEIMNKL